MSPIPSVATAFTLSSAAPASPSVAFGPDSGGQSASVASQHLLGTGGLLFAVVALLSVAAYFYHGRRAENSSRTSNTWAPLSGLLLSMRRRGSVKPSTAAGTNWPDLEVGFEHHVNMVYARFFHPTFWNLVECHPATPSAPGIFVEDETDAVPVSDLQSPGVGSFLDMDDDDDDDGADNNKHAREKPDRKVVPPYDMSSPTNVNFSSEIIGTTIRPGAFLSVPGELEDSSECSPSDSEEDSLCSPYEGIVTTESELDFSCSPYGGIVATPSRSSSGTRRYGVADMENLAQSPEDTIPEEGCNLVPTISRQSGLFNLSNFVGEDATLSCRPSDRLQLVRDERLILNRDIGIHDSRDGSGSNSNITGAIAVSHEGRDLMRELLAELRDPDLDCTPRPLSEDSDSEYYDDEDEEDKGACVPRTVPPWPSHGARRNSPKSTFSPGDDSDLFDDGPHYPLASPPKPATSLASALEDLQDRMLLPVSEDSDSGYDDDEVASVPCLMPPWSPLNVRRSSPESTFNPGSDSDVSDNRLSCPLTPPSKLVACSASVSDVDKDPMSSPVIARLDEEVLVLSPTALDSLPSLPTKAYVRSHRVSRSLLYGPWTPLVKLPRI